MELTKHGALNIMVFTTATGEEKKKTMIYKIFKRG